MLPGVVVESYHANTVTRVMMVGVESRKGYVIILTTTGTGPRELHSASPPTLQDLAGHQLVEFSVYRTCQL